MANRQARRDDATGSRLIEIALVMIDESIGDPTHFEAAEWSRRQNSWMPPLFANLTAQAVTRRAGSTYTGLITNRWPSTESFLADVLRRGFLTAHSDGTTYQQIALNAGVLISEALDSGKDPISVALRAADDMVSFLLSSPRILLPSHFAPYLTRLRGNSRASAEWAALGEELITGWLAAQTQWGQAISIAATASHFVYRPPWSSQRMAEMVQVILNGYLTKRAIMPDRTPVRPVGHPEPSEFALTVEALALGMLEPVSRWA